MKTNFVKHELEGCLKDARARKTCEGSCECHEEGVEAVRVIDPKGGHDWGYWAYCPAAIREDKSRGLEVLKETEKGFN